MKNFLVLFCTPLFCTPPLFVPPLFLYPPFFVPPFFCTPFFLPPFFLYPPFFVPPFFCTPFFVPPFFCTPFVPPFLYPPHRRDSPAMRSCYQLWLQYRNNKDLITRTRPKTVTSLCYSSLNNFGKNSWDNALNDLLILFISLRIVFLK